MPPHGRTDNRSFGCFHAFLCIQPVLESKTWFSSTTAAPILRRVIATSVLSDNETLKLLSRARCVCLLTFFLTLAAPSPWQDTDRLPDTSIVTASPSFLSASVLGSFVSRFCVVIFQHCLQSLCSRSFPDFT